MADATLTEDRPRQSGGTSTREDRLLAIDTPLGKDKLVLTEFGGEEEISQPFLFTATMRSEDPDIKPESLIGSKVTIWIKRETADPVPISGMVRSLSSASVDVRGFREYQAEIVPWLWFLSCTTDCRIFQNLTFPKIIETIFGEKGFTDYETSGLTGSYQKLDFCVQYRETALAFISRWMEELGIFYFFRHEANRHVMVLADQNRAFKPVVEKDALFGDQSGSNVSQWRHSYQFRSGKYAHKDFAFKTPSQDLSTTESSLLKLQHASAFEIYDYPGGYTQKGDGQQLTRLRMEEHEAAYHTVAGASICASFFAGGKFTMARHHVQAEEKQEYVLRRVAHQASDYTYITANRGPPSYDNTFRGLSGRQRSFGPPAARLGRWCRVRRRRPSSAHRRDHPYRQARPGEAAVSLGPARQKGRQKLLLGAGVAELGGQGLGRRLYPACRPGGGRLVSGRRPGHAAGDGPGLQRGEFEGDRPARQQDAVARSKTTAAISL